MPLWLRTDGNERGVRVEAKGKKKREDIQPVPPGLKERQKIFDIVDLPQKEQLNRKSCSKTCTCQIFLVLLQSQKLNELWQRQSQKRNRTH